MILFSETEIFTKTREFLLNNPNGVLEIIGPTASGKTGYSIFLAQKISRELGRNCEIISVDSRQVFRGMDISSAKITTEEMAEIPHHGLDICDPENDFSVVDFQRYAYQKIREIQERGNVAILCGGTMLWLDAVSENYIFSDKGEKSTQKGEPLWEFLKIGLHWDRQKLYDRLNERAKIQFETGLIEESREILQNEKITRSAITSFGYLELKKYFDGEIDLAEALRQNQKRNRNYAKRQLTWWRGRDDVFWLDMEKFKNS